MNIPKYNKLISTPSKSKQSSTPFTTPKTPRWTSACFESNFLQHSSMFRSTAGTRCLKRLTWAYVFIWVSVNVMSLCYVSVCVMFYLFLKLLEKLNIFLIHISIFSMHISNVTLNISFTNKQCRKVANSLWKVANLSTLCARGYAHLCTGGIP